MRCGEPRRAADRRGRARPALGIGRDILARRARRCVDPMSARDRAGRSAARSWSARRRRCLRRQRIPGRLGHERSGAWNSGEPASPRTTRFSTRRGFRWRPRGTPAVPRGRLGWNRYLVTWSQYSGPRARCPRPVRHSGRCFWNRVTPDGFAISAGAWSADRSAIAWNGTDYLVGWLDGRSARHERRLRSARQPDRDGPRHERREGRQRSYPAVSSDGNDFVSPGSMAQRCRPPASPLRVSCSISQPIVSLPGPTARGRQSHGMAATTWSSAATLATPTTIYTARDLRPPAPYSTPAALPSPRPVATRSFRSWRPTARTSLPCGRTLATASHTYMLVGSRARAQFWTPRLGLRATLCVSPAPSWHRTAMATSRFGACSLRDRQPDLHRVTSLGEVSDPDGVLLSGVPNREYQPVVATISSDYPVLGLTPGWDRAQPIDLRGTRSQPTEPSSTWTASSSAPAAVSTSPPRPMAPTTWSRGATEPMPPPATTSTLAGVGSRELVNGSDISVAIAPQSQEHVELPTAAATTCGLDRSPQRRLIWRQPGHLRHPHHVRGSVLDPNGIPSPRHQPTGRSRGSSRRRPVPGHLDARRQQHSGRSVAAQSGRSKTTLRCGVRRNGPAVEERRCVQRLAVPRRME